MTSGADCDVFAVVSQAPSRFRLLLCAMSAMRSCAFGRDGARLDGGEDGGPEGRRSGDGGEEGRKVFPLFS